MTSTSNNTFVPRPRALAGLLLLAALVVAASASAAAFSTRTVAVRVQPAPHYPMCRFVPSATGRQPANPPCVAGGFNHFVPAGSTGYFGLGVRTTVSGTGRVTAAVYQHPVAVQHAEFLDRPGEPLVERSFVVAPIVAYRPDADGQFIYEREAIVHERGNSDAFIVAGDSFSVNTSQRRASDVRIERVRGGVRISGVLPSVGTPAAPARLREDSTVVPSPQKHLLTPVVTSTSCSAMAVVDVGSRCETDFAATLRPGWYADGGHPHLLRLEVPVRARVADVVTHDGAVELSDGRLRVRSTVGTITSTATAFLVQRVGGRLRLRVRVVPTPSYY